MGQFLQTNGDYNIKTGEGAKIVLDTGPGVGEVKVTGNLVVEGETLTVSAAQLEIDDNVIIINNAERGPGVTLDYSGILVDRGDTDSDPLFQPKKEAAFIYDETQNAWIIAHGAPPGPFNFEYSKLKVKEILTDVTADGGDLLLIGTSGSSVVKVRSNPLDDGSEYQSNVSGPNDIPNKKYVDDAIQNNPTFQILADDTRVIITEKDVSGSELYLDNNTGYDTNGLSAVSVLVDGNLIAQFYDDKLLVGEPGVEGIEIDGVNYEIRTEPSITDQNIFIKTAGTGNLRTNHALQLDQQGTPPGTISGSTIIYGGPVDTGSTGVYFVNDSSDPINENGELISKKKALVFSMLF